MQVRQAATLVLVEVVRQGRSLDTALEAYRGEVDERERGLLQELCYGVLRWYPRLVFYRDRLLRSALKARDTDIACLILLGLYQLRELNIPAHAAVSETVQVTRLLEKPWASGLVNALLRRFQREADALAAAALEDPVAAAAHPAWLLEALQSAWPEAWPQIVEANNRRPPMVLRVNLARGTRDACLAELEAAGIPGRAVPGLESAVQLDAPVELSRLPGFAEGRLSVQDGAAQLAAELLAARPGERVLDACAAPGGKTAHILEGLLAAGDSTPRVTAVELEPARMARLADTLSRLGLAAQQVTADAGNPQAWWDGVPYDRILLDAPCSASGVIRRHPDIKLLRRATDIPNLARRQAELLGVMWSLLKPGGMLLYATCSILPQEGEAVVAAFLAAQANAVEEVIAADWGQPARAGRYVLTGDNDMDGFYYARLRKTTTG